MNYIKVQLHSLSRERKTETTNDDDVDLSPLLFINSDDR